MSSDLELGEEFTPLAPDHSRKSRSRWFFGCLAVIAIVVIVTVTATQIGKSSSNSSDSEPRNVILLIPDGTGPASFSGARSFGRVLYNNPTRPLTIDSILVGTARSQSSSSLVTDSAAGATAYACCEKSYNGAIAVDNAGLPLGTLMEAAKKKNMVTGFVVTSTVTHATPASFSSHLAEREDENNIALQQATQQYLDFALGGGRRFYSPSTRPDGQDLEKALQDRGYWLLVNRSDFDNFANWKPGDPTGATSPHPDWAANTPFPAFGLFSSSHMNYEIDRWMTDQPSLLQMSNAVLNHLENDKSVTGKGGRGFMMMIEGSRVDHAGHANDAPAHMRDLLMFDDVIASVLAFQQRHPNTLILSVADHETGGFTIGAAGLYEWYPELLIPVNMSTGSIATNIMGLSGQALVDTFFRLTNMTLTATEQQNLINAMNQSTTALSSAIAVVESQRSYTGWTTGGHSGVDVNVYGSGMKEYVANVAGNVENIQICKTIQSYLDLDLAAVTAELRANPAYTSQITKPTVKKSNNGKHWDD